MKKIDIAKRKALEIISRFPKSNNIPFLRLKDGRKVFFNIFIKKYGLDGSKNLYSDADILRRIRVVEFFDYMLKDYDIEREERGNIIIESNFYRMIIGIRGRKGKQKLSMISFYHYI